MNLASIVGEVRICTTRVVRFTAPGQECSSFHNCLSVITARIYNRMSRKTTLMVFAIAVLLLLVAVPVGAQAEDPIASEGMTHHDTSTTLYAASTFFKCTSDLHITVTSIAEISSLIKKYTAKGVSVKIRATRPGMHSASGFVCPGKRSSTKLEFEFNGKKERAKDHHGSVTAIILLLHKMNRVVDVNKEAHQLTVEVGMTLLSLLEAAEANNMSVPVGAPCLYANLTVGGVICASAHGAGSSLAEIVTKLKWVNAKGEVVVSDVGTEEGDGLLGGLGLMGVVTEVTLQLEPWSRTEVEVRDDLDDEGMVVELERVMREETKFGMAYWRPDLGIYRSILLKTVREGEEGFPALDVNGTNVLLSAIGGDVAGAVSELHAAWGNDVSDDSEAAAGLNAAACSVAQSGMRLPIFHDNNDHPTTHATLPTNRVPLSPECSPNCYWEPHHVGVVVPAGEFVIKRSLFSSWVHDVKRIVLSELSEVSSRIPGHGKSCLPGPFLLRFGSRSPSPLSPSTGNEDVVFVQWLPEESARTPRKPGKHAPVWETIEQLTLCKYKGRPSYGQNHERTFKHPKCHVRDNFPEESFRKMREMQEKHDPDRVFEPELFEMIVKRRGPEYGKLCAMQHWCFCEEDEHCAERHACVASPVFPEYKICKVVVGAGAGHDEL